MSDAERNIMSAKHTPGPWTFRKAGRFQGIVYPPHVVHIYADAKGRRCTEFIANCESIDIGEDVGEDVANAHLIAAAPELLEALKELIVLMDLQTPIHNISGAEIDARVAKAEAAIKKARGEL
jgi:hypothetical protein